MDSNLDEAQIQKSNVVDMSSSAISSRLREVSELHQLGLSLAKAKPMATAPHGSQATQESEAAQSQSCNDMFDIKCSNDSKNCS